MDLALFVSPLHVHLYITNDHVCTAKIRS